MQRGKNRLLYLLLVCMWLNYPIFPHPYNVINDVSHTISNVHFEHVFPAMKNFFTDKRNRLRREG